MATPQDVLDAIEALEERFDAAIDAAENEAAATRAERLNFRPITTRISIWFDAVNGDDTNIGNTPATPVKTWAAVAERLQSGQLCEVNLMSDIVLDTLIYCQAAPPTLRFKGVGNFEDGGTGLVLRNIISKDSINVPGKPGGIWFYGPAMLAALSVNFISDHSVSLPVFYNAHGPTEVNISGGTISKTGTSPVGFFRAVGSCHYHVANFAIDPSASGFVIFGVGPGDDPNDLTGVTANFEQA